ncbi:MAG: hypothetical protein WD934_03330 [Gemmatimonadales bacterium]
MSAIVDTSIAVWQGQMARIKALTPAERLARALALSELGRRLAWAGAVQVAEAQGPAAVRHRFLVQVYGATTADWVARCIAREGES